MDRTTSKQSFESQTWVYTVKNKSKNKIVCVCVISTHRRPRKYECRPLEEKVAVRAHAGNGGAVHMNVVIAPDGAHER